MEIFLNLVISHVSMRSLLRFLCIVPHLLDGIHPTFHKHLKGIFLLFSMSSVWPTPFLFPYGPWCGDLWHIKLGKGVREFYSQCVQPMEDFCSLTIKHQVALILLWVTLKAQCSGFLFSKSIIFVISNLYGKKNRLGSGHLILVRGHGKVAQKNQSPLSWSWKNRLPSRSYKKCSVPAQNICPNPAFYL